MVIRSTDLPHVTAYLPHVTSIPSFFKEGLPHMSPHVIPYSDTYPMSPQPFPYSITCLSPHSPHVTANLPHATSMSPSIFTEDLPHVTSAIPIFHNMLTPWTYKHLPQCHLRSFHTYPNVITPILAPPFILTPLYPNSTYIHFFGSQLAFILSPEWRLDS